VIGLHLVEVAPFGAKVKAGSLIISAIRPTAKSIVPGRAPEIEPFLPRL
jgi:hypothetical protein